MNAQNYFLVTGILFAILALVHIARLVNGWPFIVGDFSLPISGSVLGIIIAGFLSFWAFRLR